MQGIRNSYRDVCNKMGSRMEKDLLLRFSEYECVMLAPIVPHFSDNIWRNLLKKTSSIWKNSWPVVPAVDAVSTCTGSSGNGASQHHILISDQNESGGKCTDSPACNCG